MSITSQVLDLLARFFVDSRDFNGIPGRLLLETVRDGEVVAKALRAAISSGDVTLVSPADFVNPHVKPWAIPVERQLEALDNGLLRDSSETPASIRPLR